jgi:hypothetical protein
MNILNLKTITLAILSSCIVGGSLAHGDVTCVKKRIRVRNNQVRLGNAIKQVDDTRCPRGFKELATQEQALLGFAHISSGGLIKAVGGAKTSSVSVNNTAPGVFKVTFFGDFGEIDDVNSEEMRDRIIVMSNAGSTNYNVTNATVSFASFLSITVDVYVFSSDNANQNNGLGFYLSILQAPKSSS